MEFSQGMRGNTTSAFKKTEAMFMPCRERLCLLY